MFPAVTGTCNQGAVGGSAPVAAFSAIPLDGPSPVVANFADESTNTPTAWLWVVTDDPMFGTHAFTNGTSSASQHPQITFTHSGTPMDPPAMSLVTLTVTNAFGADNEIKPGYITVFP